MERTATSSAAGVRDPAPVQRRRLPAAAARAPWRWPDAKARRPEWPLEWQRLLQPASRAAPIFGVSARIFGRYMSARDTSPSPSIRRSAATRRQRPLPFQRPLRPPCLRVRPPPRRPRRRSRKPSSLDRCRVPTPATDDVAVRSIKQHAARRCAATAERGADRRVRDSRSAGDHRIAGCGVSEVQSAGLRGSLSSFDPSDCTYMPAANAPRRLCNKR